MINRGAMLLGHAGVPLVALAILAASATGFVSIALVGPSFPTISRVVLSICGYDPVSGAVRADGLAALLVQIYFFASLIGFLYLEEVRQIWQKRWARVVLVMGASVPLAGFAAALFVGRAVLALPDGPPAVRPPMTLPAVTLTDSLGQTVSTESFLGRVVVVTFVYADCLESCPLLVNQVQVAMRQFPPEGIGQDLVGLAITLDPTHDTKEVLADAVQRWHIEDPRLRLATGDAPEIQRLLSAASFWQRVRAGAGWDHTDLILVLDRRGHEAYSTGANPSEGLTEAIGRLLND